MTSSNGNLDFVAAAKLRAKRYRIVAGVVVLAGLLGAGVVYWLGSRTPDHADDPAMLGFNRAEERQMGILFGKQGRLYEDLTNSLKQPGTQAILIVAAAAVVAIGCFYFARILEEEAQAVSTNKTRPD